MPGRLIFFSQMSPTTTTKSISCDTRLMSLDLLPVAILQTKVQRPSFWIPSNVYHTYGIKNHCAAVGNCCAAFFFCAAEQRRGNIGHRSWLQTGHGYMATLDVVASLCPHHDFGLVWSDNVNAFCSYIFYICILFFFLCFDLVCLLVSFYVNSFNPAC